MNFKWSKIIDIVFKIIYVLDKMKIQIQVHFTWFRLYY